MKVRVWTVYISLWEMAELGDFLLHAGPNAKRMEVDLQMMEYAYVDKCNDIDTLRAILAKLKSGEAGYYPDVRLRTCACPLGTARALCLHVCVQLMQRTKDKLMSLMPINERIRIERLRAQPSPNDVAEAEIALSEWAASISSTDQQLRASRPNLERDEILMEAPCRPQQLRPVRGRQQEAPARSDSSIRNTEHTTDSDRGSTQRLSGYAFREWDKFDVDKAIQEIDDEQAQIAKPKHDVRKQKQEEHDKRKQKYLEDLEKIREEVSYYTLSELQRENMSNREKLKGNECYRIGEQEQAYFYYSRALALCDTNAVIFANRAMAGIRLEKFDEAERDCTRAIELDPSYVKAWSRRGMVRVRRGKYGDAVKDFTEALSIEPGNKKLEELIETTKAKYKVNIFCTYAYSTSPLHRR
jgi:tetratricopeptide (TPR) repeat protein